MCCVLITADTRQSTRAAGRRVHGQVFSRGRGAGGVAARGSEFSLSHLRFPIPNIRSLILNCEMCVCVSTLKPSELTNSNSDTFALYTN